MRRHLYIRPDGPAKRPGRILLGLVSLISLLGLLSLAAAQADGPNRAGLIVANDGNVIKKCVEFSEDEINGYDMLKRAGLELNVDASGGMGAAICRIDGTGCSYPEENCFCRCQGADCRFWIYWHLDGGDWQFSGLGASNTRVRHGDVEGWIWGEGSPNTGGAQPPRVTFEEICAEPPTATPSPTATDMPTATPVPPAATATPEPVATPVIHHFTGDRAAIYAGESVVLSWDLSDAEGAYLRYNDVEEGVIAPGSKTVSPGSTTTYRLIARNDGGEAISEITITVNGAPPTPTPGPVAAAAGVQAAASAPTAATTAAPEPAIRFEAGALTLPPGACTSLKWEVQQASAVYLDESEVDSHGSQEVCPAQTRPYTLRALYPGGERTAQVTLEITQRASTAPPTEVPSLAPVVLPTATATLSASPSPVTLALARPIPREAERRSVTSTGREETGRAGRLLAYAGVAAAIFLFLVVPVALLGAGWVAWWLRRRP